MTEQEDLSPDLFEFDIEDEEDDTDLPIWIADKFGITNEEYQTTVRVLETFKEKGADVLQNSYFKQFRTLGIDVFLKSTSGSFYDGIEDRETYNKKKLRKQNKKRKEKMMKQLDFNHQNATKLRKERLAALAKLEHISTQEIPMLENIKQETADDSVTIESVDEESFEVNESNEYYFPKSCYTCKARFLKRHHFYDRLCPPCAELNWNKRTQRTDLSNNVVILTGGRVKIGFRAGLKLLRDGCELIITTRFPQNAAKRYLAEIDSPEWKHRLHFYGLDLRDLASIVRFTDFVKEKFSRLDAIVNNAAQTVRRPVAFYRHLIPEELESPGEEIQQLLLQSHSEQNSLTYFQHNEGSVIQQVLNTDTSSRSALLSQIPVTEEDYNNDKSLFPEATFDVDQQQVDLRERNSWVMKLEEILPIELVEVHCVNVMGPFILNSQLKELMQRTNANKFIINVSAMEGKFYRAKTPFHPHTNMAKAGLNMMTKTCANDYAESNIYMNSIDTGWIHDENPFHKVQDHMRRGFQTPIDEEDAAARILDPIYLNCLSNETPYGKFFKDYKETSW